MQKKQQLLLKEEASRKSNIGRVKRKIEGKHQDFKQKSMFSSILQYILRQDLKANQRIAMSFTSLSGQIQSQFVEASLETSNEKTFIFHLSILLTKL